MWRIISLCCLMPASLWAQSDSSAALRVWAARLHSGFIIAHSPELRDVSQSTPVGVELDWASQSRSERAWRTFGCYPRTGVSLHYTNYGNPRELGNNLALLGYFEPQFRLQKRWNTSFRMGAGIAYLNQVYDSERNPRNLFYSSPISFILQVNFGVHYRLNPHWRVGAMANFYHISNGGISNPNKGMNYPMLSLGIDYTVRPAIFVNRHKTTWRELYPRRHYWQVFLFGTAKPVDKEAADRQPIVGLSGQYSHIVGRMSALTAGAEGTWNTQISTRLERSGQAADPWQAGVLAGHELLLGKFTFGTMLGAYLYRAERSEDWLYQRYTLTGRLGKHLALGVSLKSHRHVADFLDMRLGWRW